MFTLSLLLLRMPYAKLSQEDDIFSSVGGLEMGQEGDAELVEHASTSYDRAVEPSRLVLVKGVPLSAPDEELSNMFQVRGLGLTLPPLPGHSIASACPSHPVPVCSP